MSKLLQEKQAEINDLLEKAKVIYDQIGDAEPNADQKKSLIDTNKLVEEKESAYVELEQIELGKEANQKRLDAMRKPVDRSQSFVAQAKSDEAPVHRSVGSNVVDDPQFKTWLEAQKVGGQISGQQFGHSPRVPVEGGMKALLTGASATSGGAFVVNDRKPIFDPGAYMSPLTIRDLLSQGQTDSDVVEYVRQTAFTNNAAPVAEATGTSDGTGQKPQSTATLEVVQETVKTIAHWMAATRRSLADASQIRTWVETLLRYGLNEELEDQILNGNGAGENFTGIYNTTGTSTQAWDTNMLTTTRKARTKVRVDGKANPTAYVMHPTDWETIDLLKDAEDRYYFGGPTVMGNPRLWGLPVVESESNAVGFAIVADWRLAFLWDRQIANILVSDSHSDFFTRNLIAILAEMRAAFGVIRPKAFVEIDTAA